MAAECAASDDKAFVAGLSRNRAGRILASHLAAKERSATGTGHDSAVTEALGNERVFMHALGAFVYGQRQCPCGLASPMPRFIAILNLSGERMMVYSNNPALIRMVCRSSSALHAAGLAEALQLFETYPLRQEPEERRFVLLTYSMPWQAGADADFWHLSACSVQYEAEGNLVSLTDRVHAFSVSSVAPFKGKPVLDPRDKHIPLDSEDAQLDLLTLKQIEDFEEAYSATCLDGLVTPPNMAVDGKHEHLLGIMQELTRERARDQAENRMVRARLKEAEEAVGLLRQEYDRRMKEVADEHSLAMEKLRNEHDAKLLLSKQEHSSLRAEIAQQQGELSKAATAKSREIKAREKAEAKLDEVRRQSEGQHKLHNAALNKQRAEIAKLESRLEEATSEASTLKARLDKEHAALVMRQQTLHAAALDKVHATLASKERIINQLSENNERLGVEKLSLKSHDDEQAATIARLEKEMTELAVTECTVSTRDAGIQTCNASTATHHCASTQTVPEPVPATAPSGVKAPQTYQSAIDLLQGLVRQVQNGSPHAGYGNPNVNGYPIPLPYPHFMPNGCAHGPYRAPAAQPHGGVA